LLFLEKKQKNHTIISGAVRLEEALHAENAAVLPCASDPADIDPKNIRNNSGSAIWTRA
jgi:hypothetical protein